METEIEKSKKYIGNEIQKNRIKKRNFLENRKAFFQHKKFSFNMKSKIGFKN